jgi:hypothetical protein
MSIGAEDVETVSLVETEGVSVSEMRPLTHDERKLFDAFEDEPQAPPKLTIPVKETAKACTMRFFDPQPDITAFELAEIMGGIGPKLHGAMYRGVVFDDDVWEGLPQRVRRHWSET